MTKKDLPEREAPTPGQVDPEEFARAMLGISAEDAAKVRERTPATRKRAEKRTDPSTE